VKCAAIILLAQIARGGELDPKSLLQAGEDFDRTGQVGKAIDTYQQLFVLHGDSPEAKKALLWLGRDYEKIAILEQAAHSYQRFAALYPAEAEAPDALTRAFRFYRALGSLDATRAAAEEFVKLYGAQADEIQLEELAMLSEVGAASEVDRVVRAVQPAGRPAALLWAQLTAWRAACSAHQPAEKARASLKKSLATAPREGVGMAEVRFAVEEALAASGREVCRLRERPPPHAHPWLRAPPPPGKDAYA
jgi:tetratricopeptide (TPR) repeat protein